MPDVTQPVLSMGNKFHS